MNCISGRVLFEKINRSNTRLEEDFRDWDFEAEIEIISFIYIFDPIAINVGGGIISSETKELIMESFSNVKINKAAF